MATEQTSIKPCCVTGHIHEGTPKGTFGEVAGLRTYISKPKDGSKQKTVVLITDIFGVDLNNTQLVADEWAENGFYVYLPDFFDGDAISHDHLKDIVPNLRDQAKATLVSKAASQAKSGAALGPWLVKHREAVVRPLIEDFFKAVKADPETGTVAAVGFCWGGRYALIAGRSDFPAPVDVVVAYHPSFVANPADLENLAAPVFIGVGDKDDILPEKDIEPLKSTLVEKLGAAKVHVKVYPDAVHGFSVRGDDMIEKEKKQKEDAAEEGIKWVNKWV